MFDADRQEMYKVHDDEKTTENQKFEKSRNAKAGYNNKRKGKA